MSSYPTSTLVQKCNVTKWPTDLHRELSESEFEVLLENVVPKTIEKGKNLGMKVFNGK